MLLSYIRRGNLNHQCCRLLNHQGCRRIKTPLNSKFSSPKATSRVCRRRLDPYDSRLSTPANRKRSQSPLLKKHISLVLKRGLSTFYNANPCANSHLLRVYHIGRVSHKRFAHVNVQSSVYSRHAEMHQVYIKHRMYHDLILRVVMQTSPTPRLHDLDRLSSSRHQV